MGCIERVFLGWHRPLCETVPEWFLQAGGSGRLDYRDRVIVMPTRQASWRLRSALPLAAHERYEAALLGPEIVTSRVLMEPPPRAGRASELQSLLAWCAVLRETPAGALNAFLGTQRPGSQVWALQIARRLIALRRELADGALTMADVLNTGKVTDEAERWQAMADLEQRYLERLGSWNLRDAITDQLAHAAAGILPAHIQQVVLAAVPDPPRLLLNLLSAWADGGGTVTVLVAAPQEESVNFDGWGRPRPEVWIQRDIALDDRDLVLAADPEDQARRMARILEHGLGNPSKDAGAYRPAVAIGVPDRETVVPLQRELAARDLPAFDPQNRSMADTSLFRLVRALLDWKARTGYPETAALLRHPHLLAALTDGDDVLRGLDRVQAEHLPVSFSDLCRAADASIDAYHGDKSSITALRQALHWLTACRRRLQDQTWSEGLRDVLRMIYEKRRLRPECAVDQAFRQAAGNLDQALRELAEIEEPHQAGADVGALLMARLQGMSIHAERNGERLDLEGWLELAWNPAPLLVVAGMNEGLVPDSRIGDLFLPDRLRSDLALRDDRSRVARDSYLLNALVAQRSRSNKGISARIVMLIGKRTMAGDPLRPSRLLFRCPDEALAQRARRLFRDPPPTQTPAAYAVNFKLDAHRLPRALTVRRPLERISPTTFKTYLACPFRFYLQRILKMESVDDRAREPDGGRFGDLCHAVLEQMGRHKDRIWACGDSRELGDWLARRVREMAAERYGEAPWLGVTLAVESAVNRLRAFARRQTDWHALGWDIVETETRRHRTVIEGITIDGKIDRIDRNRDTDAITVWDYKTTDRANTPAQTHLGSVGDPEFLPEAVMSADSLKGAASGGRRVAPKRWLDLQLPLYREMVGAVHGSGVGVGYILLPAALGETAFVPWEPYDQTLHRQAVDCAGKILRRMREGVFWPPAPKAPKYDDFHDIILDQPDQTVVAPPNPWSLA